nr:uncharacterized protein LOC110555602 [Meriones unguiculatus]
MGGAHSASRGSSPTSEPRVPAERTLFTKEQAKRREPLPSAWHARPPPAPSPDRHLPTRWGLRPPPRHAHTPRPGRGGPASCPVLATPPPAACSISSRARPPRCGGCAVAGNPPLSNHPPAPAAHSDPGARPCPRRGGLGSARGQGGGAEARCPAPGPRARPSPSFLALARGSNSAVLTSRNWVPRCRAELGDENILEDPGITRPVDNRDGRSERRCRGKAWLGRLCQAGNAEVWATLPWLGRAPADKSLETPRPMAPWKPQAPGARK